MTSSNPQGPAADICQRHSRSLYPHPCHPEKWQEHYAETALRLERYFLRIQAQFYFRKARRECGDRVVREVSPLVA